MEVHGESSQGKFLKEISLSDCGGSQGGYATKFQCAEEFSDVALESPRKYKKVFPSIKNHSNQFLECTSHLQIIGYEPKRFLR